MKVSFLVPARDKVAHVGPCVRSVLAQTYPGLEILLSDQGSVDGTREVMASLVAGYKGPHKIRVVDCPDTECRGMAGLNAHLRWLHRECEGDIVLMTAADDVAHPERAQRTVDIFTATNASFVGTSQQFCTPDGTVKGITAWPSSSGMIDARTHLFKLTGSSSSTAWARDLVDKYDPFEQSAISDVAVPYYACLERGFYFLAEQLHAYIRHADPNNTGLEGALRAAEGNHALTAQITEQGFFQLCHTYLSMLKRVEVLWPERKGDDVTALHERFFEKAVEWTMVRSELTGNRVPPLGLRS